MVRYSGRTYGIYVEDECFDTYDYDDGTDHDTGDDTDDDTDDGGRGNLYTIKVQGSRTFVRARMSILVELWT